MLTPLLSGGWVPLSPSPPGFQCEPQPLFGLGLFEYQGDETLQRHFASYDVLDREAAAAPLFLPTRQMRPWAHLPPGPLSGLPAASRDSTPRDEPLRSHQSRSVGQRHDDDNARASGQLGPSPVKEEASAAWETPYAAVGCHRLVAFRGRCSL